MTHSYEDACVRVCAYTSSFAMILRTESVSRDLDVLQRERACVCARSSFFHLCI